MSNCDPRRAFSVGGLIKKILAINPNLSTSEIINIIKGCTRAHELGETVDEEQAFALARQTLPHQQAQA